MFVAFSGIYQPDSSHKPGTVKAVATFLHYSLCLIPLFVRSNSGFETGITPAALVIQTFPLRNGINSWSKTILTKNTISLTKMDYDNYKL